MPYPGDFPSNPVDVVLTADAATVTATLAGDHDTPAMWFRMPVVANGSGFSVASKIAAALSKDCDIVMLWDGADTAQFANYDAVTELLPNPKFDIPDGVQAIFGILPKDTYLGGSYVSQDGSSSGGPAKNLSQWDAEFAVDLRRRLAADMTVDFARAASFGAATPGSSQANPLVVDLRTNSPTNIDLSNWGFQNLFLSVIVGANQCAKLAQGSNPGVGFDQGSAVSKLRVLDTGDTYFGLLPDTPTLITLEPYEYIPYGTLTLTAAPAANVAGTVFEQDGTTPAPANVALYRVVDPVSVVEAPAGTYTHPGIPEGEYVLNAWSRVDGRDISARHIKIPQGEREVGGPFIFT